MGTTTCSQCGEIAPSGARRCPNCGATLGTRPRGTGNYRFDSGDVIDNRYEIVELLPGGGMGELYRVRHLHLHDDRVIKLLRSDQIVDETHRKRFSQEARIAASIKHPNVAIMHDFASLPDGTFYMVEEYVEGTTISRTIRAGRRFSLPEVVDIARQVLLGLAAIHEKGIIHRDISPDNILLSESTTGMRVKIIDLGSAKSAASAAGQALTSAGLFIGKPHYASPEQMKMVETDEEIDHRTDLYSLGVVLYEMIVGKVPFEAATPLAYVLKQISEEVKTVNRDVSNVVPPDLDTFIVRLLKTNRNDRFSTAVEALQALDGIRLQLPTLIQPLPELASSARSPQAFPLSTPPRRPSTDEIPFDQLQAMDLEDRTGAGHTAVPGGPSSILLSDEDEEPATDVQPFDDVGRRTEQIERPSPRTAVTPAKAFVPPPPPAAQEPRASSDYVQEAAPLPRTLAEPPAPRRASSRLLQVAIAVPLFLIVVATGGYMFYRWLDTKFGAREQPAATAAGSVETATVAAPATTPVAVQPPAPDSSSPVAPDTATVAPPPATTTNPPVATTTTTTRSRKPKVVPPPPTETVEPPPPVPETVATETVAPPPPTREGEIVAPGPGVQEPQIVRKVTPIFPPSSRTLRGKKPYILLSVLIGPDGRVERAQLISGSGYEALDKLAEEAARNTSFTPAMKDGVRVRMYRTLRFDLK